jgi:hypothetical protein
MVRREGKGVTEMKVIIMMLGLLISSCGLAVSGQTTKTPSQFDGATEFRMDPAWACSMCQIKIGVYRTTRMAPKAAVMTVQLASTGFVANPEFASGKSLFFMVDDKIYSFESKGSIDKKQSSSRDGKVTRQTSVDTQEYDTTKDFLKTLINGKRVVVKVKLVGGEYLDGIFPDLGLATIRSGLADFYQQAF